MEKLITIQSELKVPKGNVNKFGNYKYRSAEDILESVKPLLKKHECKLSLTDEIVLIGSKIFLKAAAVFNDGTNVTTANGFAETAEHKGMSAEQTTGTASSYARKYALNGLFLIDETEADTDSQPKQEATAKTIMLTDEQFEKAMKADIKGILATLQAFNGNNGKAMTQDQNIALAEQMGVLNAPKKSEPKENPIAETRQVILDPPVVNGKSKSIKNF